MGDGEAETEGATLRNALDNAFSVECTLRVCMKPGNRDVPYKRLQGPSSLTLALVYAALEDVLSQVGTCCCGGLGGLLTFCSVILA